MARIRSAHAVRFVFALCAFLAWASVGAFSPAAAFAGPLEGVTRPLGETVGAPVQEVTEKVTEALPEVTETVTHPVQEVTEAVNAPVEEVTEAVSPPVKEATAPVVQPVKEAAGKLPATVKEATETATAPIKAAVPPAVHTSSSSSGSPSGGAAKSVGGVVREVTGTVNRATQSTADGVRSTGRSSPSSTGGGGGAAGASAATAGTAPRDPDRASGTSSRSAAGPGRDAFEVASSDGAVRAPLPKWMAYVWPAIALAQPAIADLLARWEQHSLRLALAAGWSAGGDASGEGPVVAGVHAEGGRPEASDSSASPFSKVPSAIGRALDSEAPTSLLAYLCFVAIAVVAVFWAVSREIVVGRRHGRDQ